MSQISDIDPSLAVFLARFTSATESEADWGSPVGRLHIRAYLADQEPPPDFTISVRCVVVRAHSVLVQRDVGSIHILPGGRREPLETPLKTLRRELMEETGWTLDDVALLGFMHFHHLDPKSPGHRYPYPDFIQSVYTARARDYCPEGRLDDGYEVDSTFLPVAQVRELKLTPHERLYLEGALRAHGLGL
ncbi:MAG: NUDIX hydrolase [Chloroflexota bacterium]|nr:NUDIX hydrolase [Chloroflexota bacterium]